MEPDEVRPHGRDAEEEGGGPAVVVGHVLEGEVPGDQGVLQGQGGDDRPEQDDPGVGPPGSQQVVPAPHQPDDQGDATGHGAGQGQEHGALAEGGVHGVVPGGPDPPGSCDLSRSGWAST